MSTNETMSFPEIASTYEILRWCNQVLQGQFRKYGSVINQVAVFCVRDANSLEEAKERFKEINLAVARILSTGVQKHRIEDLDGDTPEILEYAEELNNHINIREIWMKLKILAVEKSIIAINQETGEEKTGKIIKIDSTIKVDFGNEIQSFAINSWKEYGSKSGQKSDYFRIKEVF
ncbi:hypothetical protein PCC9214_05389 (plasmid) [Planktothrix tepida]|uniref:Uncharacterized protein n=1 Tax=Planktothrix tepida PCC 9214 TaxID=671072 RepID=A0A1J1LNT9_9CYAN|nr:hypothetical protein [Planktothrix tepida]CAD5988469.1 hypothetical protein PCC9214_05389 [Planktothrix tepida]CUR33910.1 hypothetical protein PL921460019 [Planktothrix tepida PCC 9214]